MRKFSQVMDLTEDNEAGIKVLKARLEDGISLLRRAQENIDDQIVFAGACHEIAHVVKDISVALTGREVSFDDRETVDSSAPNVNGEYNASELKCPKCRIKLDVNKPGSYDCSSCGCILAVDAVNRIGSKDNLSITRCIPGMP